MDTKIAQALLAAIACIAVFACSISLLVPLLAMNMQLLGESATAIGAMGAATGAGIIVGPLLTPMIARHIGSKPALIMSLLFAMICALCYKALPYSLAGWIALRFIGALGSTLAFVIAEAWIMTLAPPERRSTIFAVYAIIFAAAFAAGPLVLTHLGISSWAPFLVAAGMCLVAAIVVLLTRSKPPRQESSEDFRFWQDFKRCPLPFLCALCVGAVEVAAGDLLAPYGQRHGMSIGDAASLLVAFSLGTCVLQLPLGALADRYGRLLTLTLCAIGASMSTLALPAVIAASASLPLWLLLGAIGGFAVSMYPVAMAITADRFPTEDLLGVNALLGLCYGIGAMIGPLVSGVSMELLNPPDGFAWALMLFTLSFAALLALDARRTHHRQAAQAPINTK